MRLFIDTANLEQIRSAFELGFVSGVTTNPVLVYKEGTKELEKRIKSIREITCDGEIFTQVITTTYDEMIRQAKLINSWDNNITVKLPGTIEGIKAIAKLSREGIRTCATLIYSTTQALAAAVAGAAYVAPFVNRSKAVGIDGTEMLAEIAEIFRIQNLSTQVVGASTNTPFDVKTMAMLGAHVVTAPYSVLEGLVVNPAANDTLVEFLDGWTGKEF